jgi:hypothetical protein
MEQTDNFFPKDPQRRWILAQLLNVPPALMALAGLSEPEAQERALKKAVIPLPPKNINVEEYKTTLQSYWLDRDTLPIEEVIDETQARIDRLHDLVLYSRQKQEMIPLLCGYQILLADIAQEQQCWAAAQRYYANAIILAKEKKCYDLLAIALYRRAAFFDDLENYTKALDDIKRAMRLTYPVEPQLQGKLLTIGSRSKAGLAQSEADLSISLGYLDQASKLTEQPSHGEFAFFFGLTWERYYLDSAATLMAAPLKKLRTPTKAQDYLDKINMSQKNKRSNAYRQAYRDLIQTKIYCDQGYDPVALATAENVLKTLKEIGSGVHLNSIAGLLQALKERNPHNIDVLNLELELMKARQPYLFN